MITLIILLMVGCTYKIPEPPNEHPSAKTYKSFVRLTVDTTKKAFKVIGEYGYLPDKQNVDIFSVIDYLNNRGVSLLSMKRFKVMEDGSKVETTLGEELSNIIVEFTNEIAKIAPDPTPAMSLPFVSDCGDGTILIGDDMVVDPKTLGGAIIVEALNAQARGENPEEVIKALNKASEEIIITNQIIPAGTPTSRFSEDPRWATPEKVKSTDPDKYYYVPRIITEKDIITVRKMYNF